MEKSISPDKNHCQQIVHTSYTDDIGVILECEDETASGEDAEDGMKLHLYYCSFSMQRYAHLDKFYRCIWEENNWWALFQVI